MVQAVPIGSRQGRTTLYCAAGCVCCHRVRLVLREKDVEADVVELDAAALPEAFLELNPYGVLPTLADRELLLYGSALIAEYLDERYPHPPLLPPDPVGRAKVRLALARVDADWYAPIQRLQAGALPAAEAKVLRERLRDELAAAAGVLERQPYFLADELGLLDLSLAPILWRLQPLGIALPPAAARPLKRYAERLFARPAFRRSLDSVERGWAA